MIDYEEKRNFIRMEADHDLQYHIVGASGERYGTCVNLSANGIMFTTEENLAEGSELEINITPQYSVVSPLDATVEVIRSQSNGLEGSYAIAGRIIAIH